MFGKRKNFRQLSLLLAVAFMLFYGAGVAAQTLTTFTYQGRLTDAGAPANGAYDLEFKLFDGTGAQVGPTVTREDVPVTNGVFTVTLDFGAVFDGSPRALEIGVRPGAGVGAFTTLAPRQQLASSPYSIRTLSAAQADLALDSQKLGGLDATEYVNSSTVNSTFIRNSAALQTGNFNISGDGLVGGSLGINVAAPQSGIRLDVDGATLIRTPGLGGNIQFGTPLGQTGMTIIKTNRADIRFNDSTLKLLVGTGTGAMADTNGISIDRSGNVGIGTTTPTSRLTVNALGYGFTHTDGAIAVGSYLGSSSTGATGGWLGTLSNHDLHFFTNNGQPTITVKAGGGVGIGTSAPTRFLDINGTVRIRATPAGPSVASVCFTSEGEIVQCGASSLRWKKKVQPFSGGLDIIRRLRPISFNWKDGSGADIGLGAEEVAQVAPFFAFTNDKGEIAGVKYDRLNLLLINAVKAQQAQIERQQQQINELKAVKGENAKLKAQQVNILARLAQLERVSVVRTRKKQATKRKQER